MNKTLHAWCLLWLCLWSMQGFAQQPASASWPLTSAAGRTATTNGAISAFAQTTGPAFGAPSYNNRTINGGSSVSTQNSIVNPNAVGTNTTTAHANGGYVEFSLTPQEGVEFEINSLSFYMGAGNANSNGTSIEYSLSPDFATPVVVAAPGGATAFPARDVLYPFNYSLGLTVFSGQTLYLRIYSWNGSTTNRLLLLHNLVVSGNTFSPRPSVSTTPISNLTFNSVTAGGNVTSDAGNTVTERGVVYGTQVNPTVDDNKRADSTGGTGPYSLTITGLAEYTNYHLRAYAINSAGVSYGDDIAFFTPAIPDMTVTAPKQLERLDRGLVAVRTSGDQVFLSWRLLGTDPAGTAFNLYRDGLKLNTSPITGATNYIDSTTTGTNYIVRPIFNGVEQPGGRVTSIWAQQYLDIPLQKPADGVTPAGNAYSYDANDCSVGDLDGDGEYEIILKWDPTNAQDNSNGGYTGNVYLDAYKLNGTRLWRIDLGRNIRAGAHYTQFMVYDLDGDGKAELACKTADGTVDGAGVTIGDPLADYRNVNGYVLDGPEFLTIFNGQTGAAMATTNYVPARGNVGAWGDTYGNRVDRFIAAIAYLDGERPSLVMGRGYYTRLVRAAWDWRNGQLTLRWVFDSNDPVHSNYAGQGNHQMTIGDVDGDGKQEIINGSSAQNDNGRGLWSNRMGHGDALHMSDLDPDRPGLEIWQPYESPGSNGQVGAALVDAKTGERLFTVPVASDDVGRGLAADIDPRHKGYELWASRGALYNAKGQEISTSRPSINFAIWWDGDLSRELLDNITISKWDTAINRANAIFTAVGMASNNTTKATPGVSADILGDWREEVVLRSADNSVLRLFTTTIPTQHRIYTLMHDPQYRVAIAWQNAAYNQPPHPGFYLGTDMDSLPNPNIGYGVDSIAPVAIAKNLTVTLKNGQVVIAPDQVDDGSYDAAGIASITLSQTSFDCRHIGDNRVVLLVTDVNGNQDTATAIITVIGAVTAKPSVAVTRTNNTPTGGDANTVFLGYGAQQLQLTAISSDTTALSWQWSPATALSSTTTAATTFQPTLEGVYTYSVVATNQYGCPAVSDTVTLKVVDVRCSNNKVVVCHNGNSLCVSANAVAAHLNHGDELGDCTVPRPSLVDLIKSWLSDYQSTAASFVIAPNPATTQARITVSFKTKCQYTLVLYGVRGDLVKVIARGDALAGSQVSYDLTAQNLVKGTYYVQLITGLQVVTKKLVVQ
ncbi:T9SS type A sorting domain-containing protein [Paraflavitalea pollutisoli]|uniref:rhamnogalacturonan lyase family protein n=1 Tax=Paraflavitalea pollutisoli TaxID=3034143 RepID=UPI0023EDD4EA|nr:T9SS type A sorting domain-containing protein [Paraflavitalea sp. H1-2-19X]